MKTPSIFFFSLFYAFVAFAQEATYEAAPILKASEILRPDVAVGTDARVLENVTTNAGRNQYTLETPWGYFAADGDPLLMARLAEARAMAELEKVSRTEEFQNSLKRAVKAPLEAVKGVIDDPLDAVQGTAKGVWKFMNRAGESVKNVSQKRERGQGEDNAAKEFLGLSKAKRVLALQLGADPYSSNEVFQEKLEKVAWASTAGKGVFQLATLPIGGGAGLALGATGASQTFQESLRELSPADLRLVNKKKLLTMGVGPKTADRFLANPAFSPTNQTAFVAALSVLKGVEDRGILVALATQTATSETDALFCSHIAQTFAALHSDKTPLVKFTTLGGLPVALAADGRLVIALQWDTAFWSERTQTFVEKAAAAPLGQTGPLVIALTGSATPLVTAELEKRQITLLTHVLPGAQK